MLRVALFCISFVLLGFTFSPDVPENQGMSSQALMQLQAFSDAIDANTALMVMRNDKVVLERYTGTKSQSSLLNLKSATKSFGAGLLVKALDDALLTLGESGCTRPDVSVHHLVSMTSGMPKNESNDCDAIFLFDPGTDFAYSDASVNTFADKLHTLYGADLEPLMASAIMDPIGVSNWSWASDQTLSSGIKLPLRGMVRYGRLWLRGGDWDGQQVLSAAGVALATSVANPTLKKDYGYLWWVRGPEAPDFYDRYGFELNPVFPASAPLGSFLAAGCTRSWILVVPDLDLVAARSGGTCVSIQNGNTQFTDEARSFVTLVLDAVAECSDGIDNDGDGLIDFGADPECNSLADTREIPVPSLPSSGPLAASLLSLAILAIGVRFATRR
jgi:CubicO group peptidase (beta-lactamase class C family)